MRYLGIWYKKIPIHTVVWVANRDSPLSDSFGTLKIGETGNIVLFDGSQKPIWWTTGSSNLSNPLAQLLDNGNFVLRNSSSVSETYVWESFYSPTDTLLPGMKLGWNLKNRVESELTTWKSSDDPSSGDYSLNLNISGSPEMFIWHKSQRIYRNGPWTGFQFSGQPEIESNSYLSFDFISEQDEIYFTYKVIDSSITSRLVLNQSQVQRYNWYDSISSWSLYWSVPKDQCDSYAECGPYGFCNSNNLPICRCVQGFKPKNPQSWNFRDGSDGCVRVTGLDCKNGDGFLKMNGMKLPDTTEAVVIEGISLKECEIRCLKNCSCMAYASADISAGGSGCIIWGSELIDLRQFGDGGQDFYVRLAASELKSKKKPWIFAVTAVGAVLFLLIILFCALMKWRRHKNFYNEHTSSVSESDDIMHKVETCKDGSFEISLFQFTQVVSATNNFSDTNKLGEGGFGPVYKGQLSEGRDVAIKRLSARSGQGLEEFKNEILLIAKLQHRNLVRLLGCCVYGEERMLIYEFMPNKSLDRLLFDAEQVLKLNWRRRFQIIEGIAQGLLYLHKHSRLRVIHRDLKASNILLDGDMNPKISDFGMARIFDANETQANTRRIVGTYGYMSPEYAFKGLFSIKSDVFSFGVLLLEIVSGKRNFGSHESSYSSNLLAHAWVLWKDESWVDLVDPALDNQFHLDEVAKCIYVALLCVQESPNDRPDMSDVVFMLSNQNLCFYNVKQPAFFIMKNASDSKRPFNSPVNNSFNDLSISVVAGR